MYLDITILISEVANEDDLILLRQLDMHDCRDHCQTWVNLKDVRHILKGVGRILQYFNPCLPENVDFTRAEHNYLWSLFDG